jgi:prolyl-tRNA synthetase
MEVNETKLANAVRAKSLRPATEDEIRSVGAEPGYASPVGLVRKRKDGVQIVVDDLVLESPNLVAGANEEGFHLRNVNVGRDYQPDIIQDIASAQEGDACPECGHALHAVRGVEVGNIFKLGTRYSEAMGCTFLDSEGREQYVVMGSYGIGSGRLMASIAEEHHDEHGLIWPVSVAPYLVHIVLLSGKNPDENLISTAERLYKDLQQAGIEALYDDRDESPGIKFNDADLIGLPLRLTVSQRSIKSGGIEVKRRDQEERRVVAPGDILVEVQRELGEMQAQRGTEVRKF